MRTISNRVFVYFMTSTPTLILHLKGEGMKTLMPRQFLPPGRGGERSEGATRMGVEALMNNPGLKIS